MGQGERGEMSAVGEPEPKPCGGELGAGEQAVAGAVDDVKTDRLLGRSGFRGDEDADHCE